MGAIVAAGAGRAGNRRRVPSPEGSRSAHLFTCCCCINVEKIGEKGQHYESVS